MMKLNGSEKQIAWAKDIRENMLATLTELRDKEIRNLESARQKIADHESGKKTSSSHDIRVARLQNRIDKAERLTAVVEKLLQIDSAVWFIENRNTFSYAGYEDFYNKVEKI